MTKNLFLLGYMLWVNFIAFAQIPSVDFKIKTGKSDIICRGTETELILTVNPLFPAGQPGNPYRVNWKSVVVRTGAETFINSKSGPVSDPNNTFLRTTPIETTEYIVEVFGAPMNIKKTIIVTVQEIPNVGLDSSIFLCGKTTEIDLFSELDGSPETGGVWSNGTGKYDISDPNGGVFTYTIDTGGPCPPQISAVIIKPCGNNDTDKDGIANDIDLDDDNDGTPDTVEDSFCTVASLTPVFILEEDFGFGEPARSRYVEGNGLIYTTGIPQDTDKATPGQYTVATSTHIRTFNNENAIYMATELNDVLADSDANGDINGRYMAINMNGNFFDKKPIFQVKDLPVIPNIKYNFSMQVASLEASGIRPNLRIEVIDQTTGATIISQASGLIPSGDTDKWKSYGREFTPNPGTTIVTIQVVNLQISTANGNDVGIDNIFLSRQQCDFDRDGIPNSEDLDSDNDGIYDIVENGGEALDANGDGRFDTSPVILSPIISIDGDLQPDFLDIDSDGDGIIDNIEAQPTTSYKAPSGVDGNFNGVDDAYDSFTNRIGVIIKDHLNTNTDSDCLDDNIEGYDTNRNGIIDGAEKKALISDTDNDGLDDGYENVTLDRLTGSTNATNGQTIDDFYNHHNPDTPEKDWREAIMDIGPIDLTIGTTSCTSVNLFDTLTTLFLPTGIPAPTNGMWTTPGPKSLTGAHLGTLDPTDTDYIDGNYIYIIPAFMGTTCPEQKVTLNVTIDNKCKCPTITAPTKVSSNPTTCIDATTLPTLEISTPPTIPAGLEVRWYTVDKTTTPEIRTLLTGNLTTYTIKKADIKVGDTTIEAQYYDPVKKCPGEFVDFIVTGTKAPNAGTDATIALCRIDNTRTTAINFFDLIGTADTGGTWSYIDPTIVPRPTPTPISTTDENLVTTSGTDPSIDPIDTVFVNGEYIYSVVSNGCTVSSTLKVTISENPVIRATTNCTVGTNDKYNITYEVTRLNTITLVSVGGGMVTTTDLVTISSTGGGTITQPTFNSSTGLYEGTITDIPSKIGTADNNITITATGRVSSCSFTLDVLARDCNCPDIDEPTAPIGQTICEADTTVPAISATIPSGLVGRWYMPDGTAIASAQSTPSYTPNRADLKIGDNTYTVEAYNSTLGCVSDMVSVIVNVEKAPNPGANTTANYCRVNESRTTTINLFDLLGPSAEKGGTWSYTNNNGTIITTVDENLILNPGTNPSRDPISTEFVSGNYIYSIATTVCSTPKTATIFINILENPIFTATTNCTIGTNDKYNVAYQITQLNRITLVSISGGSVTTTDLVNITSTGGGIITQPTFNSVSGFYEGIITDIPSKIGTADNNITISATGRTSSCSFTLDVLARDCNCPDIDEPTAPIGQIICEDDTTVPSISATIPTGLIGRWYMPDGTAITSAQSTPSYIPSRADLKIGDNTYTVEAFNSTLGCVSDMIDVIVTVIEKPKIIVPTTTEACDSLILESLAVGDYYTGSMGTGTKLNAGTTVIASQNLFIYAVNTIGTTPCSSQEPFNVTINQSPNPTLPVVQPTYCRTATLPDYTASNQIFLTAKENGEELFPGQIIDQGMTLFIRETNGKCSTDISFTINIETPPVVTIPELEGVCFDTNGLLSSPPAIIEAPFILDPFSYSFQWLFNGSDIPGETSSLLIADKLGDYSLKYTLTGIDCPTTSNTVTLKSLENPEIVTIKKEGRSVTIIAAGEGLEYSLDGISYQKSNFFRRVEFGEFTAYARNICSEDPKNDVLFGFPEFFTPNQDGENDFWNVQGTTANDIKISIFDRYGSLMALFNPQDPGWDGKYGNLDMPGDDYWYYAVKSDGEEYRGHFSLVR